MANSNRYLNMGKRSNNLRTTQAVTNLVTSSRIPSASREILKPGGNTEVRSKPFGSKISAAGILFGSPSNSRNSAPAGSIWSSLVSQAGSGNIGSIASGDGLNLLGSLSGAGGLLSSLAGLFGGGKNTPPPLVEFQLPQSQQQTVYVGSNLTPGNHPAFAQPLNPQATVAGSQAASSQYQSAQVVQAVKQALLNSSSLNDVIAEI